MSLLRIQSDDSPEVLGRFNRQGAISSWFALGPLLALLLAGPLTAEQVSFDESGYQPAQHPPAPWNGDLLGPGFPLGSSPLVLASGGMGGSQGLEVMLGNQDGRLVGQAFYELPRPVRQADGSVRFSVMVAPAPYHVTEWTELFGGQAWLGAAYLHAGARAAQELAGVEFYFLKSEPGSVALEHFRIRVIRQTPTSFIHEVVAELGSFVAGGGFYEVSWEMDAAWSRYTIGVVTPEGEQRRADIAPLDSGIVERIWLDGSLPMVSETGTVVVGDPARFDDLMLPDVPPRFVAAPRSQTVLTGWSTTLDAEADGTPPLAYQWFHEGQPLPDATAASLSLSVGANDAGTYHVSVTGPKATVTSDPVQLTVLDPPQLEPRYVVAWGDNGSGQTDVPSDLGQAVAIGAGDAHSLAVTADGTVVAWGDATFGQTAVPPDLAAVLVAGGGSYHSLALGRDGRLVGWGNNSAGEAEAPAGLGNVLAMAVASTHSMAVRSDHTLAAWVPGTEPPTPLENVVQVASGVYHFLALHRDGRVTAWGSIACDETHTSPPDLENVVAVACGSAHALALTADGRVVAWGDNSAGQSDVPPDLPEIQAIAAGVSHSLALTRDGQVIAWGSQTTVPPWLEGVTAIAAGANHNLALMREPVAPPAAPRLTLMTSEAGFQIEIAGEPGTSCILEVSPDLSQWTPIDTFLLADMPIVYLDGAGDPGPRFYRAVVP